MAGRFVTSTMFALPERFLASYTYRQVITMNQSEKTDGIARGFLVAGSGIVAWYVFIRYLRTVYGSGAPFFLDSEASRRRS